jgi:gas vesicle protein
VVRRLISTTLNRMSRRDWDDDDAVIVIEEQDSSSGIAAFILGAAIGAGLALIFAPQTGRETRQTIKRGAQKAGEATKRAGEKVSDALSQAKADLETRIDSAKSSLDLKKVQVSRAMDAGRAAAKTARDDLERRLAEQRIGDASALRDDDNGAA